MAALKNYRYKIDGLKVEVHNGLFLNNPRFGINKIDYFIQNPSLTVELIFWETGGNFKHSHSINITPEAGEGINKTLIETAISDEFPSAYRTDS